MHTLHGWQGQVLVVNFWATWCVPCVEEMPSLQALHEAVGPDGVQVLAISVDEGSEEAAAFIKEHGLTLPTYHDPGMAGATSLQVTTIPTTFLIDRNQVIRSRVLGSRDWSNQETIDEVRSWL
jgi:thiol-disulfide isomerase/thioredoxin